MSYILDALKKSEQDRGHGNIPDVQTVHSSGINYQRQKKAYWPYILIIAVLLNLAAITYFIFDKDKLQSDISSNDSTTPTIATNSISSSATTTIENHNVEDNAGAKKEPSPQITHTVDKVIQEPVVPIAKKKVSTEQKPSIQKKKVKEPEIVTNDTNVIDFNELPESIRQELPGIVISAHVYSSNPLQRSIVINNSFMDEGEYLIDGLVLYEITPEGAIFSYQGYLFRYGAVSGWQ